MTTARLIEHRITREILLRREEGNPPAGSSTFWTERLIAVVTVTAALVVVGSYSSEVLWAGVAIATLVTLR